MRNGTRRLVTLLMSAGFALGFQHFFKPPDGNIPENSPLVFKFKLIFVRGLVLFEKWYQEASHTLNVCRVVLKTSGFALGFQHFFKPPDGNIPEYSGIAVLHRVYNNLQKIPTLTLEEEEEEDSPLVFFFKLIFVRELVLLEKWYQDASQ